jgi:hypothetical protein
MPIDPSTPIRLGFEAARLGLRAGSAVIGLPLRLIEGLLARGEHDGTTTTAPPDAPANRARPGPPAAPEPAAAPVPPSRARRQAAPARPAPVVVAAPEPREPDPPAPGALDLEPGESAHIDDELELVGEFAEPGAEDGAGAEVRVDEPFGGYKRMRVADVRDRVARASVAELAVIQLYEQFNRNRQSILTAVERRSKELANEANAPRPSNGR